MTEQPQPDSAVPRDNKGAIPNDAKCHASPTGLHEYKDGWCVHCVPAYVREAPPQHTVTLAVPSSREPSQSSLGRARCGRCGAREFQHPLAGCVAFTLRTVEVPVDGIDTDALLECLSDPDEPITQDERRALYTLLNRVSPAGPQPELEKAQRIIREARKLVAKHGMSGLYTENFMDLLDGGEYGTPTPDR